MNIDLGLAVGWAAFGLLVALLCWTLQMTLRQQQDGDSFDRRNNKVHDRRQALLSWDRRRPLADAPDRRFVYYDNLPSYYEMLHSKASVDSFLPAIFLEEEREEQAFIRASGGKGRR